MKITMTMRVILVALSLIMTFSLFACGEETGTLTDEQQTNAAVEDTTPDETDGETDAKVESDAKDETDSKEETTVETEAPACEHEEEAVAGKAPTCTETGLTDGKVCSKCGETLAEQTTIAALGHDWDEGTQTKAPTCTEKGEKTATCKREGCNVTDKVEIDALGHDWDEGTQTKAPTCAEDGLKTATCKRADCGETDEVAIPALGHTPGEATAENKCQVSCTVCKEPIGEPQHTAGAPNTEDGCNVNCTVCGEFMEGGVHAAASIADEWTPIEGKDESGDLYEARLCKDCGGIGETRKVAFQNNVDGIKIHGVQVGPANPNNAAQTQGLGGATCKSHTYDAANLVDVNGNALTVTDQLTIYGWFACNGGTAKFVYKINDGAWTDAVCAPVSLPTDDPNNRHVAAIESLKLGIKDYHQNVIFTTGGMNTGDLQDYAGQAITITFGAIPANNQGSEDDPNVITMITINNVSVVCDHSHSENKWQTLENNPQREAMTKCTVCGAEGLERNLVTTEEGLIYFSAEQIKAGVGASGTIKEENGMKYVSITPKSATSGEENFYLYQNAAIPLTNVGGYVAVLYRSSLKQEIQLYLDSTNLTARGGGTGFGGIKDSSTTWKFVIAEYGQKTANDGTVYYDGANVVSVRFDQFNTATKTLEDTTDVVFVAFFTSEEAAYDYFAKYLEAFIGVENCEHVDDGNWIANEGKIETHCLICKSVLQSKVCDHPDASKLSNIQPVEGNPMAYSATCALCGGTGEFTNINQEGLRVITAADLMDLYNNVGGQGGPSTRYSGTLEADTNGLAYFHATTTKNDNGTEGTLMINSGKSAFTGVGRYISVLYKKTGTTKNSGIQFFVTPAGTTGSSPNKAPQNNSLTFDSWCLVILDVGADWADANVANGFGWTRIDILNGAPAIGDSTDVAYITFSSTPDAAVEYYARYAEKYGTNTAFLATFDDVSVGGSKPANATAAGANKGYYADLSGVTYTSSAVSVSAAGWFVTPGGTEKYIYRVTPVGEEAVVTELTVGKDGSDAVKDKGTALNYGDDCAINASLQGAGNLISFNLSAYAGKTVKVEVIAVTNAGQNAVILTLDNVTIPQ